MEEGELEGKEEEQEAKNPPESPAEPPASSETPAARNPAADEDRRRAWWTADALRDAGHESAHRPAFGSPRWDFCSISFPDLGSRESQPLCLASPDPSLLPGALAVGLCDVASWRERLNVREIRMSSKERKREHDNYRHKRDVNRDREVCSD